MTKPSTLLLPEATRLLVEAPLSWGAIVDPQGQKVKTPLHLACQEGHLACVLALLKAFLLSKGADPDLMDNDGDTALVAAIQFQRLSTIDLLAPVTQKGLGRALQCLAISQTELTPAIKKLLERASSDKEMRKRKRKFFCFCF